LEVTVQHNDAGRNRQGGCEGQGDEDRTHGS